MRGAIAALIVFSAGVFSVPAVASDWECFGPDDTWCGWTVRQSRPDLGWGVVNKARLPGLIVETVIDSQLNVPALRVRVAPVPVSETARVLLSLRPDPAEPAAWQSFLAAEELHDDGTVHFVLTRPELEAVIQSRGSAHLYVFVELRSKTTDHKLSHKVTLSGLKEALRFARLGR